MGSLMHRQNGKGVTVELTSVDGKPYLVISTSPKKVVSTYLFESHKSLYM